MLKFRSLKLTIVLQFLLILTPIVLVLLYQVYSNVRRADEAGFERQSLVLIQQAQENYRIFLNGLADAVDTRSVGRRALEYLSHASESLRSLQSWDHDVRLEPILIDIGTLSQSINADPRIESVIPRQPMINQTKLNLQNLANEHEARVQKSISDFAHNTKRQEWIILLVMCITLVTAVTFIYELAKPLNRAVTLAQDIAAGDFRHDRVIDTRGDIGGLLTSLAAMRRELRKFFLDLTKSKSRLANAQHIAGIGDWELDLLTHRLTRSDEAYTIFQRSHGSTSSTSAIPLEIVHPEDRHVVEEALYAAEYRGEDFNIDFRITTLQGETRYLHGQAEVTRSEDGRALAIAGTVQDITQRKLAEFQIQHLALHDGLTGLPNRALFAAQSEKALAVAERAQQTLATVFLDLDRFKNVNDSLGHQVGDALLRETANRILMCLRKTDLTTHLNLVQDENVVARMGGDEFTLLLTNLRHAEDAARVAERILASLALPFDIEGNEIVVTASIGIAVYPFDGTDSATLLKNADAAMYFAKSEGRNNYQFFTHSMKTEASTKLTMENDLRKALAQNQFVLHFQPQVNIETREIFGVEALIRWKHPTRGMVPPLEFIPIAEECGLIVPIGEWVLREACKQLSAWHKAGLPKISMAVNMASPSFRQSALPRQVSDALQSSGLEPHYLELEVTESIMMQDMEAVIPLLRTLKTMGIQLSLDDFGTGYSSLSYLQRFPLDALKIDRSFMKNSDSSEGSALVQAIIAMAKSLHLHVIAEGVETEEQATFLASHQCETMQGYLFSPPIPAEGIAALLQAQAQRPSLDYGQAPMVA
jgi:diguanylate cyclase (GGDEF)-like protein